MIEDLERRAAEAEAAGDTETAELLRDSIARIHRGESGLREQVPGRMGLGSSQERYAGADRRRGLPKKPDPLTGGYKPGGRRRR